MTLAPFARHWSACERCLCASPSALTTVAVMLRLLEGGDERRPVLRLPADRRLRVGQQDARLRTRGGLSLAPRECRADREADGQHPDGERDDEFLHSCPPSLIRSSASRARGRYSVRRPVQTHLGTAAMSDRHLLLAPGAAGHGRQTHHGRARARAPPAPPREPRARVAARGRRRHARRRRRRTPTERTTNDPDRAASDALVSVRRTSSASQGASGRSSHRERPPRGRAR